MIEGLTNAKCSARPSSQLGRAANRWSTPEPELATALASANQGARATPRRERATSGYSVLHFMPCIRQDVLGERRRNRTACSIDYRGATSVIVVVIVILAFVLGIRGIASLISVAWNKVNPDSYAENWNRDPDFPPIPSELSAVRWNRKPGTSVECCWNGRLWSQYSRR